MPLEKMTYELIETLGIAANALQELNNGNPDVDYDSIGAVMAIADNVLGKSEPAFVREFQMSRGLCDRDVLIDGWKCERDRLGQAKPELIFRELRDFVAAMREFKRRPNKAKLLKDKSRRSTAADICRGVRSQLILTCRRHVLDGLSAASN